MYAGSAAARSSTRGVCAAVAVGVAVAVLVGACRDHDGGPRFAAAGHSEPQRGGTLRFSINDKLSTLDPALAYDEYTTYAMGYLFSTLVAYEPAVTAQTSTTLVPGLAETWSLEDGRVYRFHLRAGLTYQDGRPIVAADFKYSLERILRVASPFRQYLMGIAGAPEFAEGKAPELRGVRIVDDRQLSITLREPDAAFVYFLAMPFTTPLSRDYIESLAQDQVRRRPLSSGPFVLAHWSEGEQVVFERNPRYWNPELPYLDRIVMYESVKRETAFLKFLAGEIDTVDRLSSPDYIFVAAHPAWQPYVFNVPGMNVHGVKMNCQKPPFNDKRVRQAMNYALSKERQIKLRNGRSVAAHGALPPGMPGYNAGLRPYPHDPARARALLAEAGYPDGFSVEYITLQDQVAELLAQSLKADLAEVGVDVEIVLMSFPTYVTAVGKPELLFHYTAWIMDYPDPSSFLEVKFHSRGIADENSTNDARYANPEVDRLLDAARREPDPSRRWAMYRDIEALLYDEAPWIWNFHNTHVEVVQPYVKGYHPHPVWLRNYTHTWLDLDAQGQRVRR